MRAARTLKSSRHASMVVAFCKKISLLTATVGLISVGADEVGVDMSRVGVAGTGVDIGDVAHPIIMLITINKSSKRKSFISMLARETYGPMRLPAISN